MLFWWKQPHKHYWVNTRFNTIKDGESVVAEIMTYQCFSCGSVRYDKIGPHGLISSTITDANGKVTS